MDLVVFHKKLKLPKIIAVVPLPGIPKVNKGTNDPEHAALFALSGAANPFKLPFQNLIYL